MSAGSHLFQSLKIQDTMLSNRVVVAPMCQYSAVDGVPQAWHMQHYGCLAASGPGMIVIEATGVTPRGRISPYCPGLFSDACAEGFARLVAGLKAVGTARIAVQLNHAGRKASSLRPWEGNGTAGPDQGGWQIAGPSPVSFGDGYAVPKELDANALVLVRQAFAQAAERADQVGLDAIELHSAHGYLLHQFLSPLSNRRADIYGGDLENRMRFPLEVIRAVRRVWPSHKPLGIRISATDWAEGGFVPDEAVTFAQRCKDEGMDYICVSSGGMVPHAKIPLGPGYQVALAERIRRETGLITRAVGLIVDPRQAEAILAEGKADLIALGRGFIDDPRWVWRAAADLGEPPPHPPQYQRATSRLWPGAALRGHVA